jgi:hypothetical protein
MLRISVRLAFVTAAVIALPAFAAMADDSQIMRGKYLVTLGGCNDGHIPGYFFGNPDMSRFLGGSDVGFEIPGEGVFVGPNITPDKKTGIGSWTPEQIVKAIQVGERADGRILVPIMPWHAFATLTADDAMAIAAPKFDPGQQSDSRSVQTRGKGFDLHFPDCATRRNRSGCGQVVWV